MRTIGTIILVLILTSNLAIAQDTMYTYKSGSIVAKRAISEIDSVIFYKAGSNPLNCGTISDFDGNTYSTVRIGSQCWMGENLKTTHYSNGAGMVNGTSTGDTRTDYTTKYYFNYGDAPSNAVIYGKLYNWAAVMNGSASSNSNPSGVQGVCPTGWHVPSDAEWTTLRTYLGVTYLADGGEIVAGGKLKEIGTTHWQSPNYLATNQTGFTALPGGYRLYDGTFIYIGYDGTWWSSSESSASNAWNRSILYNGSSLDKANSDKVSGFSVRCVKD